MSIGSWISGWFQPQEHAEEYEFCMRTLSYHATQLQVLCDPESVRGGPTASVLGRTWLATITKMLAASPNELPLVCFLTDQTLQMVFATARLEPDKRTAFACRALRFLSEGKEWRE